MGLVPASICRQCTMLNPCGPLQNLHPPDPLTILCQPVSRFLSSSPFPFSWGLTLQLNGKALKCNSARLGKEDRNTWFAKLPPEVEVLLPENSSDTESVCSFTTQLERGKRQMSLPPNWNHCHAFLAHQLIHSVRQRTTDSQRNGRMAQKGCKCFDLSHKVLLRAPC